jgi:hypothetical protein
MKRLTPLLALALLAAQGYADTVEDAIHAALSSYKAGKNMEAVDQLKKASDLINEKAGNTLTAALPKTIGGWNGGKITTKTLSEIGGGQGAERNYRKGDKEDGDGVSSEICTKRMVQFTSSQTALSIKPFRIAEKQLRSRRQLLK